MYYKCIKQIPLITIFAQCICASAALANTTSNDAEYPVFGGSNSVPGQLAEDSVEKRPAFRFPEIDTALEPWFGWKQKLNEKHGLILGTDYAMLTQRANSVSTGDKTATSGVFRLFGNWTMTGRGTRNTGGLVFRIEHRHLIGSDVAPGNFGGNLGYLGVTGTSFLDVDGVLNDFYWNQKLNDGQSGFAIGRYDPNNFIDVLGHANPWTTFSNIAILFNPSMALPSTSWGVGAGSWFDDKWYAVGTINDANGTLSENDFFEDGSEFFKAIEFGWSPSSAERYFKNIHVTYWHVDKRKARSIPQSDGISFGANMTLVDNWMLFGRLGRSDGLAPMMKKSTTIGFYHRTNEHSDKFGLGINRGDPSNSALSGQTTMEFFYRWQVAKNLALTPSMQWLIDPAFNPNEDEIWVLGLRARLSL